MSQGSHEIKGGEYLLEETGPRKGQLTTGQNFTRAAVWISENVDVIQLVATTQLTGVGIVFIMHRQFHKQIALHLL